jgi:predicted transcriptional regulator
MKNLVIQFDQSIKHALKKLNKSGKKCLVVVSDDEKFLGTLSDGDVRKAILNGQRIKSSIQDIFNKNSTYLLKDSYSNQEVKDIFLKNKFDLIPIIDSNSKVIDILYFVQTFDNGKNRLEPCLSVPTVIMAGGKGTRLEPFTNVLPKPLVPVNEKTIIEHIIERFTDIGCLLL